MFASGALHGVAFAIGVGPTAIKNPMTVDDATDSETIRGIADNVTPFPEQAAELTSAVGSCDDSDQRGTCDQ
jgi:hypothetical protein